jgi:hypothetical protein
MENVVALTAAERDRRDRLEMTLTRGLQTLLSRADRGEDSVVMPLVNRLRTEGIPMTDVRVKIEGLETPIERFEHQSRVMERWIKLHSAMHSYKWDDFLAACSRKIDITGAWKNAIATAIGGKRCSEALL